MKGSKKMIAVTLTMICSIALISGSMYADEGSGRKMISQKLTGSVNGDGEAYTSEELTKKLGISLKELEGKIRSVELPISEAMRFSGKVNNGVHTPTVPVKTGTNKPTSSTKGDGKTYTLEELAKKLGITVEELERKISTFNLHLFTE